MERPVKVLLSAYACDPSKGSECAVGWGWATKLAEQGYEVWVITHSSSRAAIDNYLHAHGTQRLHFHYHQVGWLPKAIVETQPGAGCFRTRNIDGFSGLKHNRGSERRFSLLIILRAVAHVPSMTKMTSSRFGSKSDVRSPTERRDKFAACGPGYKIKG